MTSQAILAELKKIVDQGITAGQAFDAIVNLRREQVTWAQIEQAFSATPDTPLKDADTELNDDSPMPFGKYAGKPMRDIDAGYLHWLWGQRPIKDARVERYIQRNLEALKQEREDAIW